MIIIKQKWQGRRRTLEHAGLKKKAPQIKQTIQLEEINPKVLVKEGRLKRFETG